MENFLELTKRRRSIYELNRDIPIKEEEIIEIIKKVSVQLPSAFNSQSTRIIVLLGAAHQKMWDITKEALRNEVAPEDFELTEQKIASFAAAYGTILYFEDTSITNHLAEQFTLYKDNFPIWASQSNGTMQFGIWTALAEMGIGASLQHYNPLIDNEVKATFNIPESYQLVAQMPFGNIVAPAAEKQVVSEDEMVLIKR